MSTYKAQHPKVSTVVEEDRLETLTTEVRELVQLVKALLPSDSVPSPEMSSGEVPKVTKRRTEDEMRKALALLLRGGERPRDDDSPQVLSDAIAEVFALRLLTMDLMHAATTMYQTGLTSIRKMTEN